MLEKYEPVLALFVLLLIAFGGGGGDVNNNDVVIHSGQNGQFNSEVSNIKNKTEVSGYTKDEEPSSDAKTGESNKTDNKQGVDYVSNSNLSELNSTVNKSIESTVNSVTSLPKNRSERREKIDTVASEICGLETPESIKKSAEAGDGIYRNTYQAKHTADVLNDHMDAGININSVEKHMKGLRKTTSKADRYTPVIGSYNRLNEASCSVLSDEDGAYEDFYLASAFFATDVAMLKYGVAYKLSFAGTRYATNRIGVTRMINICGNSCTAFLMSNGHHSLRGGYSLSVDYIQNKAIDDKIRDEKLLDENKIKSAISGNIEDLGNVTENLDECVEQNSNKSNTETSENKSDSTGIFGDVKSKVKNGSDYINNKTNCVTK